MKIRQDPVTGLWCREDGAVLLPPTGYKYTQFRWTRGCKMQDGYHRVGYNGKYYMVHQIVCRAFHGLPPANMPEVDHINRNKADNRPENLHWVDRKENCRNRDCVDQALERHGVRECEDPGAYHRSYAATRTAKKKAQGLSFKKGPTGKWGWYPRIRT